MNKIDELNGLPCKICDHLKYWDYYYCEKELHQRKDGSLSIKKFKTCSEYKKRNPANYEECKNIECVFWCNDCEVYKKIKQMEE